MWALVALFLLGLAIYELKNVLTPIFLAFLIAYLLDPLVDRFEERGFPRALGIVALLTLVLVGLTLFLLLLVPGVVHEVTAFGAELPGRIDAVRRSIEPWLAQFGLELPRSLDDVRHLIGLGDSNSEGGESRAGLASQATSILKSIAAWIWGGTSSLIGVLSTAFLVPVFAFYLLHDFDRMTAGIRDLVPPRIRPFVVDVAREIDEVLGQFVRGQLLVMLILAALYAIGYSLVGVRLAIPIGIVAGLLSFIPYVGGAAALLLALAMCALSFDGWWQVAGVAIVYSIIQLLESFLITPRIVGDKVGLPAIWVLVALMIGGELFGFLGVLLSLPAAAVAKIFVLRGVAYYRQTSFYNGDASNARAVPGLLAVEGLADSPEMAQAKRDATPPPPAHVPEPGLLEEADDERRIALDESRGECDNDRATEGPKPEASDDELASPAADLAEAIATALSSIPPPPESTPEKAPELDHAPEPESPDSEEPT